MNYLYQITNLVNRKIYVGVHKTNDIDDGYMGSGKILKHAIAKYGIENFKKDILEFFDTYAEALSREKEIVTDDFLLREDVYNLRCGGQGGFDFINRTGLSVRNIDKENSKDRALLANKKKKELSETNPDWTQTYKKNMSVSLKKYFEDKPGPFFGKTHSDETKKKQSISHKGATVGATNSQFGTCWITDGTVNSKIKKCNPIPDGWRLGRKIK
jgi:group I intron endonuclease